MTPDRHTPCPHCPSPVRTLYDTTKVLVLLLEDRRLEELGSEIIVALAATHSALNYNAPWYEAHKGNQLHSESPELEAARHPKLAA